MPYRPGQYSERIMPFENPLPENLYEVWSEINNRNRNNLLTIAEQQSSLEQAVKDRHYLRERERKIEEEPADWSLFLEAALPEAEQANWFGDVYINRYVGDAARYNDFKGTDLIAEKDTPKGQAVTALRIDVTKSNDLDKILEKIKTTTMEIENGRFTRNYFRSQQPGHENETSIDHAPRIVLHLNEDQIRTLGNQLDAARKARLPQAEAGTLKPALRDLENNPSQINLIDQAKSQLENQALYCLSLFLKEVHDHLRTLRLKAEEMADLQKLYEETKVSLDSPGSNIITAIEMFFSQAHFLRLPRGQQTANILHGLRPWIDHYQALAKEKSSLPAGVQQEAKFVSEISQPHRVLTDQFSEISRSFPTDLKPAA
ncbi:MAG: hypothetical protein RB292_04725 [Patescibacteria group bacterium]|jgi:hypothetical protein|nr:hypothetical protein [Patescibacteria group bacterium]